MPVSLALSVFIAFGLFNPAGDLIASCAWVRAENDGAGSGFIINADKKLLVTCRHISADRDKIDVIFPWYLDGELVTDRAEYLRNRLKLRESGLLVSGKVLKTSDELDLALVELESLPAGAKAVAFVSLSPRPGEPLRVIGNRLDLDTVWNITTGPLRAHGRLADGYFWRGKKLAVNVDALIGQLPTEEGDSGGPVFDSHGELVGIASALRRQCPLAAVAISAAEIRKFAGLPEPSALQKPKASDIAESLTRATVWVRPTATDVHLAGVLIENDLVLTVGKGLSPGDRCGSAFPIRDGEKWVAERAAYRDSLGLQLKGHWRGGTVLARDTDRDIALVRLDSPVQSMRPVKLATHVPASGDPIHTMNHPGGLEFAWVYAAGAIRQIGKVSLVLGIAANPVAVLVCQLPAQTGSPGGAVLNAKGELVGLLSTKESAQMVGYAVVASEIAEFVDAALAGRPLAERFTQAAALALARQANAHREAGRFDEARRDSDRALSLDPTSVPARVCRARMLPANAALAELDAAVEKGPFNRVVLAFRSELAAGAKDWRKARGDLERILDVNPADAEARQRLVGVLLELGEDVKAAAAVADTLRADPKRLPSVALDLLAQSDSLAKKYPDVPSVPAGWLTKALTAANRDEFADTLNKAASTKDDKERLSILRSGLTKFAKK